MIIIQALDTSLFGFLALKDAVDNLGQIILFSFFIKVITMVLVIPPFTFMFKKFEKKVVTNV